MLGLFIYAQVILIPILGALLLGIKRERENQERLLRESLKALAIISISRGKR